MLGQPLLVRMKACLLLLAGLAIAAQAMIPAGFMPNITEAGGSTIVICSGFEQKIIHLPAEDAPSGQHDDAAKNCAFSFAPVAEKPAAAVLVMIAAVAVPVAATIFTSSLTHAHAERAHPPTGPPASL